MLALWLPGWYGSFRPPETQHGVWPAKPDCLFIYLFISLVIPNTNIYIYIERERDREREREREMYEDLDLAAERASEMRGTRFFSAVSDLWP